MRFVIEILVVGEWVRYSNGSFKTEASARKSWVVQAKSWRNASDVPEMRVTARA